MMPPPISGKIKRQREEETLTTLEQREQDLEDQTNLEQREEDLEDLQQISGDVAWKRLLASVGLSSFSAKFANLGIENIDDMAYTTAEKADHTDLVEPDLTGKAEDETIAARQSKWNLNLGGEQIT